MDRRRKFPRHCRVGNAQVFLQPFFHIVCRQLDDVDIGISPAGPVDVFKGHVLVAIDDDRPERDRRQAQEEPDDEDAEDRKDTADTAAPGPNLFLPGLFLLQPCCLAGLAAALGFFLGGQGFPVRFVQRVVLKMRRNKHIMRIVRQHDPSLPRMI